MMSTETNAFFANVEANIEKLGEDKDLQGLSNIWVREIAPYKWSYNFTWFGIPAIQFPNDAWAMQELIWKIRPDLIIETGIAHGGSLVLYASMLAMLDYSDAVEGGLGTLDLKASKRKVLGLDIDIRSHNRKAIEAHPFAHKIEMFEGSSVDAEMIAKVHDFASDYDRILVCLDSNHSHEHVLAELEAYALLVSKGSYCCVFDTIVEDMPEDMFPNRPWGKGDNPKTAVHEYLEKCPEFEIDKKIHNKLQITVAPDGFLKRVK